MTGYIYIVLEFSNEWLGAVAAIRKDRFFSRDTGAVPVLRMKRLSPPPSPPRNTLNK